MYSGYDNRTVWGVFRVGQGVVWCVCRVGKGDSVLYVYAGSDKGYCGTYIGLYKWRIRLRMDP